MSLYRLGDHVFSDRDIGAPVVMEVMSVLPVREQAGSKRIVGRFHLIKYV